MGNKHSLTIEIKIKSEAIFTSGEKENNIVQSMAQTDSYGFVYFHAKTLKGQLKKQAFWLLKQYAKVDKCLANQFFQSIYKIFGLNQIEYELIQSKYHLDFKPEEYSAGLIKFSNLELDKELRGYFIQLQEEKDIRKQSFITPHELIEAQTNIRTGIQLEEGVAKENMLHTYHTVKKGLVFYSTITFEEEVSELLINDLKKIVKTFRRIGAGIHRGRGEIEAKMI